MNIQLIKAENAANNGKTISTIFYVSTSGSFVLMHVLMNAPGAPRPDSSVDAASNQDSLLVLRWQTNI
jgi:hypothetical protein